MKKIKMTTTTTVVYVIILVIVFAAAMWGLTAHIQKTNDIEEPTSIKVLTPEEVAIQKDYWEATPITRDFMGMTYEQSTYEIEGENEGEYIEVVRVSWLEDKYGECLYNPRKSSDGKIYYLNEYGLLKSITDNEHTSHYVVANLYPEGEDYQVIFSSPEVTVFWSKTTSTIVEKSNNTVTREEKVTNGSDYKGYSRWAGLIFQCKDTVYSVFSTQENENVVKIAENVSVVISTDFRLTSDAWSNPLFLMKDGTLKGYISWEDELFEFDGLPGNTYYPYAK